MPSPCDLAAKKKKKEKEEKKKSKRREERRKKKERKKRRPETGTGRTTIIAFGDNANGLRWRKRSAGARRAAFLDIILRSRYR